MNANPGGLRLLLTLQEAVQRLEEGTRVHANEHHGCNPPASTSGVQALRRGIGRYHEGTHLGRQGVGNVHDRSDRVGAVGERGDPRAPVARLLPEMREIVRREAMQVLALPVLERPHLASLVQTTQFARMRLERIIRRKEIDASSLFHRSQELHSLRNRFTGCRLRHHVLASLDRLDRQGRVRVEEVGEDHSIHVVCQEGIIVLVGDCAEGGTRAAQSSAVEVADCHDFHSHHLALSSERQPSSSPNHSYS
ncbi:MAG TPA: hypothetical protein VEL31_00930 [Ktedonobacteraceae bacterium]|nr:hypothetical protein [Ktedonobacteraceae bacterium]